MKASNLLSTLLLASIGLSVAASSALADVFEVYQINVAGKTKVYLWAQNSTGISATVPITVQNAPKIKVLTLNNCGLGKFKESTTSPVNTLSVGGSPVTIGSGGGIPVCTKDATTGVYSATNDLTVGQANRTADGYIWYKGGSGPGAATLSVASTSIKTIKTNQCGLASFTPATGVTQFSTDSQNAYNLNSNVPTKNFPYICKKVGSSYTIYEQKGGL